MGDEQDILTVHKQWIALEESGNASCVLDLCSDDVLWLVPSAGAIRGKAAVKEWFNSQPVSVIERIESFKVEIEVSGGLAVKRADFITKLQVPERSEPVEVRGSHLWTLCKDEAKGCWQVTNVSWSIVGELT
ncbi:nuclear transport factor 2 family protein [Pleurocapsales cyanobacterium LEGE 06147]|nr:nuclear transport factor 2 family protein [Pleurocapsales cyanobacterium LEGE 06147]